MAKVGRWVGQWRYLGPGAPTFEAGAGWCPLEFVENWKWCWCPLKAHSAPTLPACHPFPDKKQKLKIPQNSTQFTTSNSLQQFPCQPLPQSSCYSSSLIPAVLEDPGNWSKLNILKIPVIDQYSDRPPQLCGSITILWTDSPMTWRQRHWEGYKNTDIAVCVHFQVYGFYFDCFLQDREPLLVITTITLAIMFPRVSSCLDRFPVSLACGRACGLGTPTSSCLALLNASPSSLFSQMVMNRISILTISLPVLAWLWSFALYF